MSGHVILPDISSDTTLKRWYSDYRRRFFSNDLPHAKEVKMYYWNLPGFHGNCEDEIFADREEYVIRINAAWKELPDFSRLVLLHEMAHLHLWPYEKHGKKFQAEMMRLASLGAFKTLW